jgi:signal transduction histidine kinase
MLSFEDSGTGIDSKNLEHIFDPFFTTKPQGMGMGLAICQSIVEAHGGNLAVSPGIPHGTVFQIALPLARHAGQLNDSRHLRDADRPVIARPELTA